MKKNKVLLIGWDAADWKIIDKLMANGLMPAMKKLVDGGVRGKLATLDPPLSPMLWTSIATGVRPYKHGVSGFVEHDGKGNVRPVSSHYRKVKAIWNMMTMEGYKSNIIGWWPSNPVESINGCMVSNLFQQERKGKETIDMDKWDIPEGTIYPERLVERLKELRVHPSEITGNLIMPFVPQAVKLHKKEDKRITVIRKFLAHASSIHAASTELMETEEWDFTAVYHDAIDHFCHAFMKYYPPKLEGLDEEAFLLFKDVITGAYIFHDMMLERLMSLVDKETTIVLVSDHGFHSDHLRPTHVPNIPSGPAIEHAPYGVFVANGPGIKKGERIHGASILDVTPTILSLFDMPIGRDMDGKPLVDIYDHPRAIKYIDSWENVDKDGGQLVHVETNDDNTNESALQQLVDLGYIDEVKLNDSDQEKNDYLKGILKENNFYMAKSFSNGGKYDEALEILLEIEEKSNPDFRFIIEIINCAIKTKRFKLAEEYLLFSKKANVFSEVYNHVIEAKVQIGLRNPEKALSLLKKAQKANPNNDEILLELGRLLNSLRESKPARTCFKKVIKHDPENPYAYQGIGLSYMMEEHYEKALDYFLMATDKLFHYPVAHLHLAETLALMKEYDYAIQSFELVATMTPQIPKIYRWLMDLYELVGNPQKANYYHEILRTMEKGEKIIITGLPSTKLKNSFKQLKSLGYSIGGDLDDLLGEKTSLLDKEWFSKQADRIVYVPMQFLPSLNAFYSYKFVYINEDINTVAEDINSQLKIKKGTFNTELMDALEKQERVSRLWISQQPNLDIVYINNLNDLENELIKKFLN